MMPDAFWANLPTLVISFGTFVGLIIAAIAQYKINMQQNIKLDNVVRATDGMATRMAEAAKGQGAAEGRLEGVSQERDEARARATKDGERRAIAVDDTLKSIEQNTAETAVNTAGVEAKIDDLKR